MTRATELALEASEAKSKLNDLESKAKAMEIKSNEDQASYAKEVGAAKKRIAELEESLGSAKVAAQAAAQSAIDVSKGLSKLILVLGQ